MSIQGIIFNTKMATANVRRLDHHEHPLTLVAEAGEFKCSGCNEDGYDVKYACSSRPCSRGRAPFHLHEACAKQFGSILPHPLKRGDLLFRDSPSQPEHPCRGCGGKVTGYAYERRRRRLFGCILERGTVLHPCCASLPTSIGQGPLNPVKLELKRRLKSPCCKCGLVRFEDKRRTWGYVSADKVVQIHVACANRMFREAYETARRRRPSMISRLIARLRMPSGSTVDGDGGPPTERPGTDGPESDSRDDAGALPALELQIVPEENASTVIRAVWLTFCTVGAVIIGIGTGNPTPLMNILAGAG